MNETSGRLLLQHTHYTILGLSPRADLPAIKRAYRDLARRYHPDVNGNSPMAEEQFKMVAAAYYTLSDPGRRLAYDMQLLDTIAAGPEPQKPSGPYRDPAYRRRSYTPRQDTPVQPHGTSRGKALVWTLVIVFFVCVAVFYHSLYMYRASQIYDEAVSLRYEENNPREAIGHMMKQKDLLRYYDAKHYLLAANISLYDLNDYEDAGYYAISGLQADPAPEERYALLFIRGKYEMYKGSIGMSFLTFESAYGRGNGPDSALYAMAEIKSLAERDYRQGIRLAEQLIETAPSFDHAWFLKGYASYHLNRMEEAEEMMGTFLQKQPGSGIGYYMQAKIFMARKKTGPEICPLLTMARERGYEMADTTGQAICK